MSKKIEEQESLFDFDIVCPVCNKKFDSYKTLRSHIGKSRKEHLVLKEFYCQFLFQRIKGSVD